MTTTIPMSISLHFICVFAYKSLMIRQYYLIVTELHTFCSQFVRPKKSCCKQQTIAYKFTKFLGISIQQISKTGMESLHIFLRKQFLEKYGGRIYKVFAEIHYQIVLNLFAIFKQLFDIETKTEIFKWNKKTN